MLRKIDESLLYKCSKLNLENEDFDIVVYMENKDCLNHLINKSKVKKCEFFSFLNVAVLKVNGEVLNDIIKLEEVTYISSLTKVTSFIDKSKKNMNLDYFYNKSVYGEGVNIAVIDTGINTILDFCLPRMRIIKFVDFINNKSIAYDDNGHGTFVASVLLGNGLVSNGKYCGIAPKSNVIALKALDAKGESSALQILKAMQWIYDNHEHYKIKVVCMSFGSEPLEKNDPLVLGAEQLWKKGITVVAAAGNSGPKFSTIKSPAISSKIITVGGVNDGRDGKFEPANFSSRGPAQGAPKPDILAPAVDIIGANLQIVDGKGYTLMSGTSVAAPMIAGVCALLYECYPNISPDQIKTFICKNAIKLCDRKNIEGFGMFRICL